MSAVGSKGEAQEGSKAVTKLGPAAYRRSRLLTICRLADQCLSALHVTFKRELCQGQPITGAFSVLQRFTEL